MNDTPAQQQAHAVTRKINVFIYNVEGSGKYNGVCVCLCVCVLVCMYICLYVCMYVCMYVCICLYVCLSVCVYVCMYVLKPCSIFMVAYEFVL